jgi:hypothetical protein
MTITSSLAELWWCSGVLVDPCRSGAAKWVPSSVLSKKVGTTLVPPSKSSRSRQPSKYTRTYNGWSLQEEGYAESLQPCTQIY